MKKTPIDASAVPLTAKCCICKRPTPLPAHEAITQKRYNGWAPGRYIYERSVWCESCWNELLLDQRRAEARRAEETARLLAQFGFDKETR